MTDRSAAMEDGDDSSILVPFHEARRQRMDIPVAFDRRELDQILRLYGRMVAANEWRDYAIDRLPDRAVFSVFRRTSETPLFQIVKNPRLARKQGAYSVVAASGLILRRGHELGRVLGVFDAQQQVFNLPGFRGCAFVNASAETTPGSAVEAVCDTTRTWLHGLFADLVRQAGASKPETLAEQLVMLYDGATVAAQMDHNLAAASTARLIAQSLVDAALAD